MKRKLSLIASILALCILVATAAASYYKYSQIVSVTVTGDYSLTLSTLAVDGRSITLAATLRNPSNDPVFNATVYFYKTDINATVRQSIGSNKTDPSGIAVFHYSAPDGGTYYFQAAYAVP